MSYTGFWDELRKIPPVTRFLCGSSLAVTLPVMLQLLSPYKVIFATKFVTQRFELWRIWSSFFFGGGGLNYIFGLVMMYHNSNTLELGRYYRMSPEYAWQLTLAAGAILAINLPLGSAVYWRALTICILYLNSALAPAGTQTSIMGLITIPIQYLPYVMIGLDLVMGGPGAAAVSVTGAVVGHLWWWVIYGEDGRGLPRLRRFGSAPSWVRKLVSVGPDVVGAGVHVVPPQQQRGASARTTGYNWGGGGNRLGSR